jgi:hypothetical protein
MSRSQTRWAALLWLAAVSLAAAQDINPDFAIYPASAQECLTKADDQANCPGASGAEKDRCLCSNGGDFIINTAICLGETNNADVQEVYSIMANACSNSDTPMSVSQQDFFNAVDGNPPESSSSASNDDPSSTSSGGTTTNTSGSDNNNDNDNDSNSDESSGLPQGAVIGIGVGAAALGALAVGGLALFLYRRKRKQNEEENPFLGDNRYTDPTTFPPTEPSPLMSEFGSVGTYSAARASQAHSVSPSQTPRPLSETWKGHSPHHSTDDGYPAGKAFAPYDPFQAPQGVAELPPTTAVPKIVEPAAVEMDATSAPPRTQQHDSTSMPGFTPSHYN